MSVDQELLGELCTIRLMTRYRRKTLMCFTIQHAPILKTVHWDFILDMIPIDDLVLIWREEPFIHCLLDWAKPSEVDRFGEVIPFTFERQYKLDALHTLLRRKPENYKLAW